MCLTGRLFNSENSVGSTAFVDVCALLSVILVIIIVIVIIEKTVGIFRRGLSTKKWEKLTNMYDKCKKNCITAK